MSDAWQHAVSDPIQGQGHEPLKVENSTIFNGCLLPHLHWGWQMTTDYYIRAQDLKLVGARFLNFVPVFVSRDFEVGSK